MATIFLNFDENYDLQNQGGSVNLKQNKYKENHAQAHHSETIENQR